MAGRVRVVKDRSKAYQKTLESLAGARVKVGILGSKAAEPHKDQDGKATALSVVEVGIVHEFSATFTNRAGSVQEIPMRSFIRQPVERMRPLIRKQLVRYAKKAVRGETDPEKAMEFIGAWVASLLADGVRKGLPVQPLAESTKKKRRGSVYVPLFDTGQLASSISYEVEKR